MFEITHKLAEHLANAAAKYNAIENGRSWFSDSDWDLANIVYGRLTAVQIMDTRGSNVQS